MCENFGAGQWSICLAGMDYEFKVWLVTTLVVGYRSSMALLSWPDDIYNALLQGPMLWQAKN